MVNVWQTISTAANLTNWSVILICEEEVFHLLSNNDKNTNSHQEDTRVILYCMYAKLKGYKSIRIRTPDSDIFFIFLH